MPARDFVWWTTLIGKARDDAKVVDAFSKAGFAKVPKPPRSENAVQVELDETGLEVTLAEVGDEVVFAGVLAKLDGKKGDDLYRGKLLEGVTGTMFRDAVLKKLGTPDESIRDDRIDIWRRGEPELVVGYTKAGAISTFSFSLPHLW